MTRSRFDRARSLVATHWRRALLVVAVVGVLAVLAVVVYVDPPAGGESDKLAEVRGAGGATIERLDGGGYAVHPSGTATDGVERGLVFYPGGRVRPDGYLWTVVPLAVRADVAVFVPEMPLHLAVLDPGAADGVIDARPGIDRWYVGGHSLGGAMACRYATNNPDAVEGLVLLASYCSDDASDRDLAAISVTGTRDGILNRERYRENRGNLPADTRHVEIEGMNHAQFGGYGDQQGDRPATIDDRTARERLVAALVEWFERRRGTVGSARSQTTGGWPVI